MFDLPIDHSVPRQLTPEITFLKGGVSLWQYSIPFFTTNVPLSYAAEHFKLFEDLTQADTGEWTLEELFQRDISWERVETDILAYLKNPSRPQFFNALTIALLPHSIVEFGADHGEALDIPPMAGTGLGRPIGIGGIQVQYFGSDVDRATAAGRLRWSTHDVDAVAVDGQHRLAAIKRFVRQTKQEIWKDASVPVIFIIADERVGFRTPHAVGEGMRTVGALRALFIDLNKNARPVSKTRNILLDDLDVVSVATRALIGRSLSNADEETRIPLPLNDWLTDKNKIEDGPFVTTVMLLNEAIGRLLAPPDPQLDPDDDSADKVGLWLEATLPPATPTEREDIMRQVRACALQQSKLTWLPQNMEALRESFERTWRPHFHSLFRTFGPYSALWEYARDNALLNPQFVNLYVAKEVMPPSVGGDRAARLIEAAKREEPAWTIEKRYQSPLLRIDRDIKGRSWGYKVVFQRGLLRAFVDVIKSPCDYLSGDLSRGEAAQIFIEALNLLNKKGALQIDYAPNATMNRFWDGSGLAADGTIEFTNAGAERIRAWLLCFLVLHNAGQRSPRYIDLEEAESKPFKTLERLFGGSPSSVVYKGMTKLAFARDLDGDEPETVNKLIKQRYDHLRKLALA